MTAVAEAPPASVDVAADSVGTPARWPSRAAAIAVDVLPGAGVAATAVVVMWTVRLFSPWWYVAVCVAAVAILATAVNRVIAPAVTGFSLGRALLGVSVVTRDGDRVGAGQLLLRDIAHLVDTAAFLVGWLWPLWDSRRRTFADLLVRTEVRTARPRAATRSLRERTAAVVLGAALVSVAVAAMGDLSAYRPERLEARARAELQREGPKVVAQLLSFNPKTKDEDFARAQSLATDSYRAEVITAQQLVAKSKTPQEYWVPDSAVLSLTGDHAIMLIFLQGQSGNSPRIQPIHVTVRVGLQRSAGRWLVDSLAFVPPPKKPEAPR